MAIHEHSAQAYASLSDLSEREAAAYACYASGPKTDREVSVIMETDLYMARPRITSLVDKGLLVEIGSIKDPITGRKTRICDRP